MASNIDDKSGLVFQVKRPVEERTFVVDFRKVIAEGKTIASISDITAAAAGLIEEAAAMIVTQTSVSGLQVGFKASGGSHGEDYEVTVKVTDSGGDVVSDDVMIKVRRAGRV